jgi:hypothetical protein
MPKQLHGLAEGLLARDQNTRRLLLKDLAGQLSSGNYSRLVIPEN